MPAVNIIVTCAASKVEMPDDQRSFRSYKGSLRTRYAQWCDALLAAREMATYPEVEFSNYSAEALYQGQYWSEVKQLPAAAREGHLWPRLFIASAGWGLITPDYSIPAYGITFATGMPDSIYRVNQHSMKECRARWWKWLCEWRPPGYSGPRSLSEVAEQYRDEPMLVVASESYMDALTRDLRRVRHTLRDPNLLTIMSCGGKKLGVLTHNLVPADLRSRILVDNGPMRIINVRLGRRILMQAAEHPLHAAALRAHYKQLLDRIEWVRQRRAPHKRWDWSKL